MVNGWVHLGVMRQGGSRWSGDRGNQAGEGGEGETQTVWCSQRGSRGVKGLESLGVTRKQ